jgi:hypothetical protein
MGEKNQLAIPPGAKTDPKSFELIRAWVAGGDLHVSLEMGGWDDPEAWGVVLADVARHVANFFKHKKGFNPAETTARLVEAFEAELDASGGALEPDVIQ